MKEKLIAIWNGIKNFFKKATTFFKKGFVYILLFAIIALLVMYIFSEKQRYEAELSDAKQATVVNEYFVAEELKSIGEINTTEYKYAIEKSTSSYRKIFDFNVPLTEKSLSILYSGEIEVGYNISDMEYKTSGSTVKFDIPEPITDNDITNRVVKDEDNNILNPINSDDYANLEEGVREEGLNRAIDNGIYETAEENLKSILTEHFEKLGLSVIFV